MNRKFTGILAFCLLFVSFFGLRAQSTEVLKSFINKNDVAVRSVQKYSINLSGQESETNVKELLKLQAASVKLFSKNPSKSADIAWTVRQKCNEFLNANSKGSLDYLKLTDKERAYFTSPKPVDQVNSYLTKKELEKINSVDTKNPHLFDELNTRIN
jgi:hypothetical protein